MRDRDETLAGLAEVLGDVWDDGNASGLDGWVGPGRGTLPVDDQAVSSRDRATRKYAAVALAHLEAQGWAQGQEEWGYRLAEIHSWIVRTSSRERAEEVARLNPAMDPHLFVRRVTPWEPVDGGS